MAAQQGRPDGSAAATAAGPTVEWLPASRSAAALPVEFRELRLHGRRRVPAAVREHALFIVGLGVYWLGALAVGADALSVPFWALLFGLPIWGVLAALDLAAVVGERLGRPLPAQFQGWLRCRTRDPARALDIIVTATGIFAVLLTFGAAKPLIGRLGDFRWDGLFAAWDRALHGGLDPWAITHALPGGTLTSLVLDRVYLGWYAAMVATCLAVAWVARPALRQQFLLSMLLIWAIAGTLLAFLFASGGPVYYLEFTGQPGSFGPLRAELENAPLWAHGIQQQLWSLHAAGDMQPFSGISAMPSLHVAGATLIALLAARLHPALGLAAGVHWLLIMTGSVHLGWHYAIDGYAGTSFALLCWWAVGPLARWWVDRSGEPGPVGMIRWLIPAGRLAVADRAAGRPRRYPVARV